MSSQISKFGLCMVDYFQLLLYVIIVYFLVLEDRLFYKFTSYTHMETVELWEYSMACFRVLSNT